MASGKYWLTRSTKPWLLVLDNADDDDLDINECCPTGGNGYVLVTTRNESAKDYATVGSIQFRGLERYEAIEFLLKAAYPDREGHRYQEPATPRKWKIAEAIAVELGYLPLALEHAGVTIRRNIYTLEKYLNYYLGHRSRTMNCSQVSRADVANIISTWEIPFQKIVNRGSIQDKDAVDLMHIFAFLHFESIPETIFHRCWTAPDITELGHQWGRFPDIISLVWTEESHARLRRAIRVLCDHSIIDHEPTTGSCSMHPVIHNWARVRLTDENQKRWLRYAMAVLTVCISPNRETSGRKFRALLLPHINSCLKTYRAFQPPLPETLEVATAFERFAWLYMEQSLWKTARKLQEDVIKIRSRILRMRHPDTIRARRDLGTTLWNLFEIEKAIQVQRSVWKTLFWARPSIRDWASWRASHVPYCIILTDLTSTLWLAGKRDLSKRAGEAAVKGLTRRLGSDDPETLRAMFNLARTYLHLGEHDKGHQLLVLVLKKQKHFFGLNHPDTLMTRNELGISLNACKRHLSAAQRLIENVLKARKDILGDEHAYTLWSINDLSKVYIERGRIEEATKMLEDIVPLVKETLGEKHVGMMMTKGNLARAYYCAARWKEAEEVMQPVLEATPKTHPDWINFMYGYAHVKFNVGTIDESEKRCLEMLDIIQKSKIFSSSHPRTIAIADLLIAIYRRQGREDAVTHILKRYPGTDSVKNEDRFDPYAMRRGTVSTALIEKKEKPRLIFETSPTPTPLHISLQEQLLEDKAFRRLTPRQTF